MGKIIRYILGFYGKSSEINFEPLHAVSRSLYYLILYSYFLHILLHIIQIYCTLDNSADCIKSVQTARLMLNNK